MSVLLVIFLSSTLSAKNAGSLSIEYRPSTEITLSAKLNGQPLETNHESLWISDKAVAGENLLKVCFNNTTGQPVEFSKRAEAKVRYKDQEKSSLLRVLNYRGIGEKCFESKFQLTQPQYADLDRLQGPPPISPAIQIAQNANPETIEPTAVAPTTGLPPEAEPSDLASEDTPSLGDTLEPLPNEPQDSLEPTTVAQGTDSLPVESASAPELGDEPALATESELEPAEMETASTDEIAMDLPPEAMDPSGDVEVVDLPEDGFDGEEPLEELPLEELDQLEDGDLSGGEYVADAEPVAEEGEMKNLASSASMQSASSPKALSNLFNIFLILALILSISMLKIFDKAGLTGWHGLVPVLNVSTLLKVLNLPGWHIALIFIPGVNLFSLWKLSEKLSEAFAQSKGFAVGLTLAPFVFYPILGFGKSEFQLLLDEHQNADADSDDLETVLYQPTNAGGTMTATISDDTGDNTAMTEIASFDESTEIAN